MAWLAAVGALSWQSMVLFWTIRSMSVTIDGELKGLSIKGSDVRRTPRLFVGAVVIREVGFLVEDEGEKSRSESDVLKETPRLVLRSFRWFLVLEETEFEGYGIDSGDQMEVPSVVA